MCTFLLNSTIGWPLSGHLRPLLSREERHNIEVFMKKRNFSWTTPLITLRYSTGWAWTWPTRPRSGSTLSWPRKVHHQGRDSQGPSSKDDVNGALLWNYDLNLSLFIVSLFDMTVSSSKISNMSFNWLIWKFVFTYILFNNAVLSLTPEDEAKEANVLKTAQRVENQRTQVHLILWKCPTCPSVC